jgi:hypothetical protein
LGRFVQLGTLEAGREVEQVEKAKVEAAAEAEGEENVGGWRVEA